MIFAWSVLLLVGAVLLALRAVANGYLVLLRSRRYGTVVLEHGPDERYHVVTFTRLHLALGRYLALYVAYSLLLLHRRVVAAGQHRKALPLAAKA